MKFLLDTCIFLELLLDQEKSKESEELLQKLPNQDGCISEFSLYSIGIILFHRKSPQIFIEMTEDLVGEGGIPVMRLRSEDFSMLVQNSENFTLDFDDAYQYTLAEKHNLIIVSFDRDFDRTERGRVRPKEILEKLSS